MRHGLLIFSGFLAVSMSAPAWAVVYQVNSSGGAPDDSSGDGLCQTATPGECTLRAAVQQANVTGGTAKGPAIPITLGRTLYVPHDMSTRGAAVHPTAVRGNGL